mgnify:CR=1 FL=1
MGGFNFAEYPNETNQKDPSQNSADFAAAAGPTKAQLTAATGRALYPVFGTGLTSISTLVAPNGAAITLTNNPIAGSTGSFTTLTASSTVTLSPANANVTMSPTGTGLVAINPAAGIQLGGTAPTTQFIYVSKNITGGTDRRQVEVAGTVQSDVTASAYCYLSVLSTQATTFTLPTLIHFQAYQGTIGAGSTVNNQYGFRTDAGMNGATANYSFCAENTAASLTAGKTTYGFFSAITAPAAGTAYQFYASGSAPNFFAGDMRWDKTVTAGGTTGAATINKNAGSVNFAAAATSLVVTNSLVTTGSVIVATVATNDSTMKSVSVVAAAGSFTLNANAAATAETRVNFLIVN